MKKFLFMMAAVAAVSLSSCSNDEEVFVPNSQSNQVDGSIKFRAMQNNALGTRGTAVTTANLLEDNSLVPDMKVWGYFLEGVTEGNGIIQGAQYIGNSGDGIVIDNQSTGGTSAWDYHTAGDLAYWPKENLYFYAIIPAADASFSVAGAVTSKLATITADVTVPEDVADQKDIMFASNLTEDVANHTADTNPAVAFVFDHALSQVVFQGKVASSNISVTVQDIKIANADKAGSVSIDNSGLSSAIAAARQYGKYSIGLVANPSFDGFTDIDAGTAGVQTNMETPKMLSATDGALFMLPQDRTGNKWATVAGTPKSIADADTDHEVYLAISCSIKNGNVYIIGDEDNAETVYIPFEMKWEQGKKYTYTLVFGAGAGAFDEDGNPLDSMLPITYTVTSANDWASVDGGVVPQTPKPIDLSMVDNAGNARALGMSTANCYMVHSNGFYKFPLVYGNAIRNGATNASAYHTDVVNSNVRQTLVNHADAEISDPWLKNNGVTVDGVELLWQDQPEMITEVGVDGDYITFDVTGWQQGNAVISAKSGSTIVWSWHIWLTDETFADSDLTTIDTGDQTYDVTPVNIGWVKPTNEQLTGGYYGHCTFYQWGRPIAEPGSNGSGSTVHPVYGISGTTALTDSSYPEGLTKSVSIGTNLQNPTIHYTNNVMKLTPWNEYKYNYWDINQSGTGNISTHTIKTVYDPCPPDFCVPTGNLYYYMGNTGDNNVTYGYWDNDRKVKYWLNNGVETGLFFPATGCRSFSSAGLANFGTYGYYWSTSVFDNYNSRYLDFYSTKWTWKSYNRSAGNAVRAVKEVY